MQTTKTKAVIYARVSSKEQEETGYSLDSQVKLLKEYAEARGFRVAKIFRISESASGNKMRKVFSEMMDFLRKNKINVQICEKTDRLTRSRKDAVIVDEWIKEDVKNETHFVKENFILNSESRANEKFIWGIKVEVAQYYTNNLSEEVKKGQKEKLEQGWLPTTPPLGYKTIGEKGKRIHIVDSEIAPLIVEMFKLYATGQYSIQRLTKVMAEKGLRTRGGYKLVRSRMADLLSDPFYYGTNRWNGKLYKGVQEPLISKDLFDRVQEVLNNKTTPKYFRHDYLLKGLIKCEDCGGLLTWEKHKGHIYGHCNKCEEKRPWYKEEEILEYISGELKDFLVLKPRLASWVQKALKELHKGEIKQKTDVLEGLKNQQNRLRQQQSMLYQDRLDGRISVDFFDDKSNQITTELNEIANAMGRQNQSESKYYELGSKIFEISQKASDIFSNAKKENKRKILALMCEDIMVRDGKLVLEFTKVFETLSGIIKELNGSKLPENIASPYKIFELGKQGSVKGQKCDKDTCVSSGLRR